MMPRQHVPLLLLISVFTHLDFLLKQKKHYNNKANDPLSARESSLKHFLAILL